MGAVASWFGFVVALSMPRAGTELRVVFRCHDCCGPEIAWRMEARPARIPETSGFCSSDAQEGIMNARRALSVCVMLGALWHVTAMASWAEERRQVAADSAVVTSMYGDVSVRHQTGGWRAAEVNAVLRSGSAIRTGKDSRAELAIQGGGQIRLDESTHLLIRYLDPKGGSSLKAFVGNVWVSIERALVGPSGLRIEMPSAVAAVKGTVFQCLVAEDGSCETVVYEGQVECEADGEHAIVDTARCFVKPVAAPGAQRDADLDRDAANNWVQWNRRRDLIRFLGHPKVYIALAEHNGAGRQVDPAALGRIARKLTRAGFEVVPISADKVPDHPLTQSPRGMGGPLYGLHSIGDGDILVQAEFLADTGRPVLKPDRPRAQGWARPRGGKRRPRRPVYASRAHGRAAIVDPRTGKTLGKWTARRPGHGSSDRRAGHEALLSLGDRFGEDVVSDLMDALMAKGRAVRVRLTGIKGRRDIYAFMIGLRENPAIKRAFPSPSRPGSAVVTVATELPADEVAAWIATRLKGSVRIDGSDGPLITATVVGSLARSTGALVRPGTGARPRPARPSNAAVAR